MTNTSFQTYWYIRFNEASMNHFIGLAENRSGKRISLEGGPDLVDVLKELVGEIIDDYEEQVIKASIDRKAEVICPSELSVPMVTIQIDLSLR